MGLALEIADVHPATTMNFACEPLARHQANVCSGVTAETVSMGGREPFESRYCGPHHLLIAHERLARRRGMTIIEGLPASALQNLSNTLTFVPAGRTFREWHEPDIPSRAIYIHIDPATGPLPVEAMNVSGALPPRLHFHSASLWHTVLKLRALVEAGGGDCSRYGAALGVVLAHELVYSATTQVAADCVAGGGLAGWQRRRVAQYIEEHLSDRIPLPTLASIARLSRFHFCRSFRKSFGLSPHRYHSQRRIERAKSLLANPDAAITDVALEVGFEGQSAFTASFRKLTGNTPTAFRRSLVAQAE